jgi:hypothetical protein
MTVLAPRIGGCQAGPLPARERKGVASQERCKRLRTQAAIWA